MNFTRQPFVILTALFITGIVLAKTYHWNESFPLICVTIVILSSFLFFIFKRFKLAGTILLLIGIFFLGSLTILLRKGDRIELPSYTTSFVVKVEEIGTSSKEWRKAVCTITHVVDKDSILSIEGKALLIVQSQDVEVDDMLIVRTQLDPIRNKGNPGEFDSEAYWNNKGVYKIGFVGSNEVRLLAHRDAGWLHNKINSIRDFLSVSLEEELSEPSLSISKALLLGDKSMLSAETRASFSHAGAMHVLAVSGLHIGIILFLLIFVLRQFPRVFTKNRASISALIVIWFFAALTGFSPSVLRASFMFTMIVLGQMSGRKVDTLNILFFSAFVLLMIKPSMLYDLGFQLSYLAMIGILTLYDPISKLIYIRQSWLRKIWEGTAIGISAQALTMPLTLYYFHQFPNYFTLSNLGVMLFAGVILGVGLLFFTVNGVAMLSSIIGVILGLVIMVFLLFIQFIERIPGAVAYGFELSEEVLLLAYIVIFAAILLKNRKRVLWIILIALIGIFLHFEYNRFENLQRNELVIFNDSKPVIAIKCKNQMVYLARSKEEANFLIRSYTANCPATQQFTLLQDGKTTIKIENKEFFITQYDNGILIEQNGESYFVRTGYKEVFQDVDMVIDMPYLESNQTNYNLSAGAFRLAFQ